jgi:transposase
MVMPKSVALRSITEEEKRTLERVSRSRTAEQRQVERARIILGWLAGQRGDETATQVGCHITTVYYQLHQFNARGVEFLEDAARPGRPQHYNEQQRGQLVVTTKTKPAQLGREFGHWTLDRLVEYANTVLNIPISRSQLGEILMQEGLKWYQEKTYFTESPDPQFVEKRGQ